jgi:Mg2+ and Co2+ transporter CorA
MPISFVASFFGMNFFQPIMPAEPWTGLPAFVLVLTITIATPIAMYLWMRRRRFM